MKKLLIILMLYAGAVSAQDFNFNCCPDDLVADPVFSSTASHTFDVPPAPEGFYISALCFGDTGQCIYNFDEATYTLDRYTHFYVAYRRNDESCVYTYVYTLSFRP